MKGKKIRHQILKILSIFSTPKTYKILAQFYKPKVLKNKKALLN